MSAHAPALEAQAPAPVARPPALDARGRPLQTVTDATRARPLLRLFSFSLLALFGVERWGHLVSHPPGLRLVALALEGIAIAFGAVPLRRVCGLLPRVLRLPATRLLGTAATVALVLLMFPTAGMAWHTLWHMRIAVGAREIGDGLNALATVLVPYLGHDRSTRLVMVLGAAVLLLDAAAVMAGAERVIGDGRRAAAALPLIALAVVPSTLVRPAHPALQGLILFALLMLFMFGERIASGRGAAAVCLALAAGLAGALAGPALDEHHPWVDYRAWAGGVPTTRVDVFNWNQTYGTLRWPQTGNVVLSIHSATGLYWKAQDLSVFDGSAWVSRSQRRAPALPAPSASARHRWTQTSQVTVEGMRTPEVIGGQGQITRVSGILGGVRPGTVPGTDLARTTLQPGDVYTVSTYSPQPTRHQLSDDRHRYPWRALAPDLTLKLPYDTGRPKLAYHFAPFHTAPVADTQGNLVAVRRRDGRDAPAAGSLSYSPAYTLAQQLAGESASPYAFVRRVMRYLDSGSYQYDQTTPRSRYPLMDFLFSSKVGYCQQFSGAMALLLRMGGVPARVAAGFTTGTKESAAHTWAVADTDAHAWVEVWFPRYGWVKFDPTPTSAPARGGSVSAAQHLSPSTINPRDLATRTPVAKSSTTSTTSTTAVAHGGGSSAGGTSGGGGSDPWPLAGIAAGALLLAMIAAGTLQRWRVRVARQDPVAELERALSRSGREARPGLTLAELERRFADTPEAAAYVRALRLARYGRTATVPSAAGRRALRRRLAAGLGLRGRLRGLWALPPRPPAARRARPATGAAGRSDRA